MRERESNAAHLIIPKRVSRTTCVRALAFTGSHIHVYIYTDTPADEYNCEKGEIASEHYLEHRRRSSEAYEGERERETECTLRL